MQPNKASSIDGLSAFFLFCFFQKYWSTVGNDVYASCLGFLNGYVDINSVNKTTITLVPKGRRGD